MIVWVKFHKMRGAEIHAVLKRDIRNFTPKLTSLSTFLGKTKKQLSGSQNRIVIRTHWVHAFLFLARVCGSLQICYARFSRPVTVVLVAVLKFSTESTDSFMQVLTGEEHTWESWCTKRHEFVDLSSSRG